MQSEFLIDIVAILIILNIVALVLIKKVEFLNEDIIRFTGVGVLNTLLYFELFTLLNIISKYLVAHIIAFLIGALISYFLTTMYTFENKISLKTFISFPLTFLPNFILSTVGTFILVSLNLICEEYASLLTMLLAVPITFIVSRKLLKTDVSKKENFEKY